MIFFKMAELGGDKCVIKLEFTAGTRNANFLMPIKYFVIPIDPTPQGGVTNRK